MPEETVIVGDACSRLICKSGHNSQAYNSDLYFFDAVALIFAKDKNKPHGIGETQFRSTLSTGVMPFGPELRAITMKDEAAGLYIGVIQKRPSCIEQEKMELRTYLVFYEVIVANAEYLVVKGVGIQPGDTFLFYNLDSATASATCHSAYEKFQVLNPASSSRNLYSRDSAGGGGNGGVFGGLIFSSSYREESYFDSYPIYRNFPGTPLTGIVCGRDIGRDSETSSVWQEDKEESPGRCSLHVCTTVYLVFLYIPPSPDLYIN
ncbi:hypothetical protein V6N13_061250 [Hibiscus sabdariffa]